METKVKTKEQYVITVLKHSVQSQKNMDFDIYSLQFVQRGRQFLIGFQQMCCCNSITLFLLINITLGIIRNPKNRLLIQIHKHAMQTISRTVHRIVSFVFQSIYLHGLVVSSLMDTVSPLCRRF